jgi:hypothetical protein
MRSNTACIKNSYWGRVWTQQPFLAITASFLSPERYASHILLGVRRRTGVGEHLNSLNDIGALQTMWKRNMGADLPAHAPRYNGSFRV